MFFFVFYDSCTDCAKVTLGFGLLLVNIWVRLHWIFTRKSGPGLRQIEIDNFRLQRFAYFLHRAIEFLYGVIMSIPTHISPEIVYC